MDESTDIANQATLLVYVRRVGRGLAGPFSLQQRSPHHYNGRGHFQNCGFVLIVLMPIFLSMKSDFHKMLILLMCLRTSTRFNNYFHQKHEDNPWIRDPFGIDMESVMLPSNKENQLVKLSCDQTHPKFGEVSLSQFWCHDANFDLSICPSPLMQSKSSYHSTLHICAKVASLLKSSLSQRRGKGWTLSTILG